MSRKTIYFAITGHGFGHAVRVAAVAAKIKQLNPDILLILTTTAPRWLLESYLDCDFIHRPISFDVGVIQTDSLTMDKIATKAKMQDIINNQNSIMAREINYLKTNQVDLILADIPPLMAKIAKIAAIPCWLMSNFGWDFIYNAWGNDFADIAHWCSECYQEGDRLFRLPMHETMTSFRNITDVGLTGGDPRYSVEYFKKQFKITSAKEKTILLTFGGLGLEAIPYQNLSNYPDWQFLTFDQQSPNLPNLIKITDRKYRPVDFMPLCGKIMCKPGYSTFAEAMRLDVPIVSITRADFAEARLLLEGIKNYSEHQIIQAEEFFAGNWDFLKLTPEKPLQKIALAKNGTEKIAQEIVDYLNRK